MLVTLRAVSVRYATEAGVTWALRDIELRVERGQFVCLVGPSGCGKTTLLKVVAGLVNPTSGEVALDGAGRLRLGYVFQEPRLLPWATALENVTLPLIDGRYALASREEALRAGAEWLDRVGLAGFADHFPDQLSGGMRQRVALARAFAIRPDLLLMDEPFGSLDELTARRMRQDLAAMWASSGATVLFVTHNATEAAFLADRIVVLSPRPGRVVGEIRPDLPRPRRIDDPALFEVAAAVLHRLEQAAERGDGHAVR